MRSERNLKLQRLEKAPVQDDKPSCSSAQALCSLNDSDLTNEDDDDVEMYKPSCSSSSSSQMRIKLTETALIAQRFGVSDRAAALIVTSTFKDAKLISSDQVCLLTDKNKIRREKLKVGKDLKIKSQDDTPIVGLYFDGRKDETLAQVKEGVKFYRRSLKEDHISLVAEPVSKYIGHVTPKSGSAEDESNAIYEFATKELKSGLNELLVLGCDGTLVNTGWKGTSKAGGKAWKAPAVECVSASLQ